MPKPFIDSPASLQPFQRIGGEHYDELGIAGVPCREIDVLASRFSNSDLYELGELINSARHAAEEFESRFRECAYFVVMPDLIEEWDRWIATNVGQQAAADMARALFYFTDKLNLQGEPAHDRRHVLIKDPLASLAFCIEDGLKSSQTLFLIPALAHDFGRLLESRIDHLTSIHLNAANMYENADHARLSFYAVQELLSFFSAIPETLKDHLLYAVLNHQKANDSDPGKFFLHATQRCDREQIVGPEGILRQISEDLVQTRWKSLHLKTTLDPKLEFDLPKPYQEGADSWFHHVEFYLRNLHPSVGSQAEIRANVLKVVTGKFLFLASSPEVRAQIFAPENARDREDARVQGRFKQVLNPDLWVQIKQPLAEDVRKRISYLLAENDSKKLLTLLCHAPGATPIDVRPEEDKKCGIEVIEEKLDELNEGERSAFLYGVAYAIVMRDIFDENDRHTLNSILEKYTSSSEIPRIVACGVARELERSASVQA